VWVAGWLRRCRHHKQAKAKAAVAGKRGWPGDCPAGMLD